MAKAVEKADNGPQDDKVRANRGAGALLWLMSGLVGAAFFAPPTILLFSAGMVPTIVAWIVDRSRDGYTPMAVGMLNLAGLLPSMLALWTGGHTMVTAARIMSDPYTWLFAFGAAAVGWALVLGLPKVIETALTFRNEAEIKRLEDRQAALIAEWGPEVGGKSAPQ